MNATEKSENKCQVCKATQESKPLIAAPIVRPSISSIIQANHPQWNDSAYICLEDLNNYRSLYAESLLNIENEELVPLYQEVVEALQKQDLIAKYPDAKFEQGMSFGERLSDQIALFGGSWKFIISFLSIIVIWVIINSIMFLWIPFDPYPFILLNLFLSMLAAIQAPILMMSQNRQEEKDRARSENDYLVNLKAELEIRALGEKLDHLQTSQWKQMTTIQRVQQEIIEELRSKS
ncbi:MAG: putative membrane protein [Cellvibrionaceae bacterium]|jgi:uncharacterized membrane protein